MNAAAIRIPRTGAAAASSLTIPTIAASANLKGMFKQTFMRPQTGLHILGMMEVYLPADAFQRLEPVVVHIVIFSQELDVPGVGVSDDRLAL